MRNLSVLLISLIAFSSCSLQGELSSDPKDLFLEFWTFVDQNYIYFEAKNIDSDSLFLEYNERIVAQTSEDELFEIMESFLLELKDGHNRISSPFQKGKSFDFRQGYKIHHSAALVKEKYITDSLGQDGYLTWGIIGNDIGYVSFPNFNRYGAFASVLREMKALEVSKLIVDVRGNGGGNSNFVPELLGNLVTERTKLGAYIEKAGPGHNEVSSQLGIYAEANPEFNFDIPIVVLTNRSCYSATSYFAAMMKDLPKVTIMGQKTGGGGGGNMGYQLSNGWLIAVSVSDFVDKEGKTIEVGVDPDIEVQNTAADLEANFDRMLEMAIEH